MSILVTGAAGYIGSVVTEELIRRGRSVVALDNLAGGHRKAVSPDATFVQCDLGNSDEIDEVFRRHRIEAVVHLAAHSLVGESVVAPGKYFKTNVICGMTLLDTMLKYGTDKLVFSSTAAVYGNAEIIPIEEDSPKEPVNTYGESKLMFEKMLHWYGYAHDLRFICLRYFNVGGATKLCGEDHRPETHLIPLVLKVASGEEGHIPVFGRDYETKDGSCIRDYIHVLDIARAHLMALERLGTQKTNKAYNLGNGKGYSVIDVIETARKVTGRRITTVDHPRRQGDPPSLVASSALARSELGWQPEHPALESIVESAWQWQIEHQHGYDDNA